MACHASTCTAGCGHTHISRATHLTLKPLLPTLPAQFNVFYFAILGFFLLALIYFALFPSDRRHLNAVMAQIKTNKAKQRADLDRKLAQQGGTLSSILG